MKSESVWIEVERDIRLEAAYHPAREQAKGGLLALHPHPLYGGNMNDVVVMSLMAAAFQAGWAGLRFNFRGAGGSGGVHDGGQGEQQDVLAAWKWLQRRVSGPLVLSGYSFGALVGSHAASELPGLAGGIFVSPPTILGSMGDWPPDGGELLVLAGTADQFGSSAQIEAWLQNQGALTRFEQFNGQDHFWFGKESVLISNARDFLLRAAQ